MPGGRGSGPNGCCCRLCPSLPQPVLGRNYSEFAGFYSSNSDGTFAFVEGDSPPAGYSVAATPGPGVAWRQDDLYFLTGDQTADSSGIHPERNNGFTLFTRDTACSRLFNFVPPPSDPGGTGLSSLYPFNGGSSLDDIGFSNGPAGYLFASDYAIYQGALTPITGTVYNPTTVNSPAGWTNPGGVTGSSSYATTTGGGANLIATGFNFSVPTIPSSYKILGLILAIDHHSDVSNNTKDLTVYFTKDGSTTVGTNLAETANFWTVAQETYSYPSSGTTLAGTTWVPSDINSPNFGVIFNCTTTGIASIINFRIIVYYTVDGSQVYTLSSSGPTRIAVMPHSTGTIYCFSNDDFCIAPPSGFAPSATTYSGPFVQMFDGVNFTVGTVGTITLPSSQPSGWSVSAARFAQDQVHCGFSLRGAYFYTAQRSGSNLANPTQLTFTADGGGRIAVGDVWAISPDGSLLAFRADSGGAGGSPDYVHIYSGGSLAASFQASSTDNSERIWQLAFSDDGKQLAAAQYGVDGLGHIHGRVCVWNVSGTTFTELTQPTTVSATQGAAFAHGYRVP